jgi:hypothetical protein
MASVLLSDENACGVGVDLDGADGSVAAELAGEDAAAGSSEEGELAQASTRAALKIHAMSGLLVHALMAHTRQVMPPSTNVSPT